MRAYVAGVALWGPGLPGWTDSRAVLAGETPYTPTDIAPPVPDILSANERRRTGVTVRLALVAAQQAMAMAGFPPGSVASVFGCSNGDGAVVHAILETLAQPGGQVSPTQFHNSVHNAAAGYWTIATRSNKGAVTLTGHDATFAVSLLKAMAELYVERQPILLCVHDSPIPAPMAQKRPTLAPFAACLVLTPEPCGRTLARIGVTHEATAVSAAEEATILASLLALSQGNPAARALPLLELLARRRPGIIRARLPHGAVAIDVRPWP